MNKNKRFKQFSRWLKKPFGKSILDCEKKALAPLWSSIFGQRLLLLGDKSQQTLITNNRFRNTNRLSPNDIDMVYKTLSEMPNEANIIDAILLPHSLEFNDSPLQLLREVHFLLRPNGNLILIGFNPWSLFGLRQLFSLRHTAPWCGTFYSVFRAQDWLMALDFEIISVNRDFYHLPFHSPKWIKKLSILKMLSKIIPLFCSGIYIIVARKNIIGITPEKIKWKLLDHLLPSHHLAKPVTREAHHERS